MSKKFNDLDGKIAGLYDLEETLGRGHFAVVKLARHVFTGEKVAVKVIDKNKLDDISKAHLFQEVRCMKLVQHPNVIRLYEVIDTQTKLYLILELGDGGDLYDYIMRHEGGLSEEVARIYFRQIMKAISYCHHLHVVHRDLKPENVVFFEKSGTVKLTDFGFSNRFSPGQKLYTSCGSLAYSAPEILLGDSYDAPAVDVWSLGVILYMLVCGHAPFQEANDSETLTMILDCKYSVPTHISSECKDLIAKMLTKEPDKRATLDKIAKDKWLLIGINESVIDNLPLVYREQVSEEYHNFIVNKMVSGGIATKDEIMESLDKNEYNYLTATYYLLAERKLRSERQEALSSPHKDSTDLDSSEQCAGSLDHSFLRVTCFPSNPTQNVRVRKCSIVLEEEDEDLSSGQDDHSNSTLNVFHRRGSRSDGKISNILQERFVQIPRQNRGSNSIENTFEELSLNSKESTFYYKNKNYQDLPDSFIDMAGASKKLSVRCKNRGKLKNKYPKLKTHSCSSSDASDDDNENRKKRSIRANNMDSSLLKKKDSYDDSSDSQDPGCDTTRCKGTRNVKLITRASSSNSTVNNVVSKTKSSANSNDRKHHTVIKRTNRNDKQHRVEQLKIPKENPRKKYFTINGSKLQNADFVFFYSNDCSSIYFSYFINLFLLQVNDKEKMKKLFIGLLNA